MTTLTDRRPQHREAKPPVCMAADWLTVYRPVLNQLSGFRDYGNGRGRAPCPCDHGPGKADLWLSLGDGGRLLLRCFPRDSKTPACDAGAVMARLGLPLAALFPDYQERQRQPRRPAPTHHPKSAHAMRDRDPDEKFHTEAEYEYWDVSPEGHRHLVMVVTKKRGDRGSKDFPCKRPNPDFDPAKPASKANPEWVFNLQGVRKILYRRADLIEALRDNGKRWVLVPEGEKDVETARRFKFLATCNPGGVLKWADAYSDDLKGRNVLLLCDEDPVVEDPNKPGTFRCPGVEHVRQVASSLLGKAQVIKLLRLPGVPPGGDLTDWVEMKEAEAKKAGQAFDAEGELKRLMQTALAIKTADDIAAVVPRGERQWPIPEGHLPLSDYVKAPPREDKGDKGKGKGGVTPEFREAAEQEAATPVSTPAPQAGDPSPAVADLLKKLANLKLAAPKGPRSSGEWLGETWMALAGFQASLPHLTANDAKTVRDSALYLAAQLLRGLDAVPELRDAG